MVEVLLLRFEQCFSSFTMLLVSKGPPKWDFLAIYLNTFFGIRKFKNTSAMRLIVFFRNVQN